MFLEQVISADHSCRAAVARLIAHRITNGDAPCSSKTGAYCQARKRLPEKFFAHLARGTGVALAENSDSKWLWKNRKVYMFDGTTVSMPDTPCNQAAYPQPTSQTPGVGFPLARVAAIFSMSCGAILDLGIAAYSGKGQGEVTIFRQLWDLFCPGDVVHSWGTSDLSVRSSSAALRWSHDSIRPSEKRTFVVVNDWPGMITWFSGRSLLCETWIETSVRRFLSS